jgi:hypothetical protein
MATIKFDVRTPAGRAMTLAYKLFVFDRITEAEFQELFEALKAIATDEAEEFQAFEALLHPPVALN